MPHDHHEARAPTRDAHADTAPIVHVQFQHAPLGHSDTHLPHYHARVRVEGDDRLHSAFTFFADDTPLHEHDLLGLTINQARALLQRQQARER